MRGRASRRSYVTGTRGSKVSPKGTDESGRRCDQASRCLANQPAAQQSPISLAPRQFGNPTTHGKRELEVTASASRLVTGGFKALCQPAGYQRASCHVAADCRASMLRQSCLVHCGHHPDVPRGVPL